MSFNLYAGNTVSLSVHYADIGKKFCENYYNMFDNNLSSLHSLYKPNSCITYLNEEFAGFQNCLSRIKQQNIVKFKHVTVDVNVQPVGENVLFITTTGTISINDSIYTNRYVETLIVQRCENNTLYISNSVFKLIE